MTKSYLLSMEQDSNPMGPPRINMLWRILPAGLDNLADLSIIRDKVLRHGQSGTELTIVDFSIHDRTDRIDVTPHLGAPQQFMPGSREVELEIIFSPLVFSIDIINQFQPDIDFFTDFHVVV